MSETDTELRDFGWCVIELMGHRRIGAKVSEEVVAGTVMLRCEVPQSPKDGGGERWMTQFYGGSALYCLSPTTEELARAVALRFNSPPVQRYELAPVVESPPARPLVVVDTYEPEQDADMPEYEDDGQEGGAA